MKTADKLKIAFEDSKQLIKSGEYNVGEFRKKHKLTDLALECVHIMIDQNEYIPAFEIFYKRKQKCLLLLEKDLSEYTIYRFLEEMPKHSKGYVEAVLNNDETYRVYETLGIVTKTDVAELNRSILLIYWAIEKLLIQHRLDMREALAHNDVDFFEKYCGSQPKKKVVERFKKDKFNKKEIQKVLQLLQLS